MQVKLNISNDILDWVMTQVSLDDITPRVKENLMAWRSGTKIPTYNQVEEASKATRIPFGYFLLDVPPVEDLSLLDYRTVDSLELDNPSRDLIDTIHYMEDIQDWVKNDILSNGGTKLDFVGMFSNENDALKIANEIRTILNISPDWYTKIKSNENPNNFIRDLISKSGVTVMSSGIVGNNTRRPLNINEFRAFAIVDEIAPVIFINNNDSKGAQLFSLFHEFAHILLGENSFLNGNQKSIDVSPIEQLCNAVSAEILVPTNDFINQWNKLKINEKDKKISALSSYFKCGETVIARRALDKKYISEDFYYEIADQALENYKASRKRSSGGNFYNNLNSRVDTGFFNRLLTSVFEGRTQYSEAFRLTHTNRSTFSALASKVGGVVQ